jgi:2-amino-4-hydroxy-6-hydroxymethyldihydropteridine diphosphokinase
MQQLVFLSLGSNMGNRLQNLQKAVAAIGLHCGEILVCSSVYETAAWGNEDQSPFLNIAISILTTHKPEDLLNILQSIEHELGRRRNQKWDARTIDIDILFYGNLCITTPALTIPHPLLAERNFVLAPLNEIAADFVHPFLQKSITSLQKSCIDTLGIGVVAPPETIFKQIFS